MSLLSVGNKVFIRTVTVYLVGEISEVTDREIVLKDAAWVGDTGRFHQAMKDGTLDEVEPFVDPVTVQIASIVDSTKWNHILPLKQK